MEINLECIPCALNSYLRLTETGIIPEDQQEAIFRRILKMLSTADFNQSPPVLGQKMHDLITTGDNSPGAVWDTTSEEFKKIFNRADVIISKGQGNLEGLLDVNHKSIYFLLVTKCDLIGDRIGTKRTDFVVKKG